MISSKLDAHGKAGFSLLELLVVLGILSLLAGLATGGSKGIQNWLAASESQSLFMEIANACQQYRMEHGEWPEAFRAGETDLNAAAEDWSKALAGYLERRVLDRVLRDGFGNTRLFLVLDSDGDHWIEPGQFEAMEEGIVPDRIWARVAIYSLDEAGRLTAKSWTDED
ncbi:type II secretion system protein [Puniceicoccales bacterium CK1056]|uniref:Type II secretion system protein n=1 Tax=Oceanipulchritudo coccoides TaxID=2706888 RepID=A0A6B2M5W7_9BACT|nr:type II secretion system protein [Oceanipulchritudo coccoides]NDV63494.1 type II secretion system protein [Oceanipulchritudo coccoides]